MYSNFKDAFIRKPQFFIKTPDSVLSTIGKNLHSGFRYIEDHDGFCRLDCDGTMDIAPSSINISEEAKEVFAGRDKISFQEAMAYAYNAQQTIELLPDENGYYSVNGERIHKSEFVKAPLKQLTIGDGHLYILPPRFPDPFPVTLSGNSFTLSTMVQRQPIKSLTKMLFASVDNTALSISYSFEPVKNGNMQFNISTKLVGSAKQILAAKEIYNAFVDGRGELCGTAIPYKSDSPGRRIDEEALKFWHKIVDVEDALGITFDVSQEITIDSVKAIDSLYRCFVEKKPYRKNCKDCNLQGEGSFEDVAKKKELTPMNEEILFEFTETIEMHLLGVQMRLYALTDVFEGKVTEIQVPEDGKTGKFCIKLEPTEDAKMYMSTQLFKDIDTIDSIRSKRSHLESFRTATQLNNY